MGVSVKSWFIAMLLPADQLDLPFPGHGHVLLTEPAPILMYQIGSNDVRVLVDYKGEDGSKRAKLEYLEHIANQLPEGMQDAFMAQVRAGAIKTMPNQEMSAQPISRRGAILWA